jgi:hypothetical protein
MIETESAYISKINENTIKLVFKPNAQLTNEEYQTFYQHYSELVDVEKGVKFLVIMEKGFKMKDKYLNFFKKKYKTNFKLAEAFILIDTNLKYFFKLGDKLVKRKHPIELFNTEEEALKWLESI